MTRSQSREPSPMLESQRVAAADEVQLMRLLHGELRGPDAADLRARFTREPQLANRYAELEEIWSAVEGAAPVLDLMPDIAGGVRARLGEAGSGASSLVNAWLPGGLLGQVVAAVALVLGAGLGWWAQIAWEARSLDARSLNQGDLVVWTGAAPDNPAERPVVEPPDEGAPTREPVPENALESSSGGLSLEMASVEASPAAETSDDLWAASLGGAPEWDEELLGEIEPVLVASGDSDGSSIAGSSESGWDPTLADGWDTEGWGLGSSDSLALAYLDLGEDGAFSEGD